MRLVIGFLTSRLRLISLTAMLVLAGCTSQVIVSEWGIQTAGDSASATNRQDDKLSSQASPPHAWSEYADSIPGVEYYLPKRLFKVTVTREFDPPPIVTKSKLSVKNAAVALSGAESTSKTTKNESDIASGNVQNTPTKITIGANEIEDKKAQEAAIKLALATKGKHEAANLNTKSKTAAFEKSLSAYSASLSGAEDANLVGAVASTKKSIAKDTPKHIKELLEEKLDEALEEPRGECEYKISFKVEDQGLVPDPRYRFIAQLNHSLFRDDDFSLQTTATGLLSNAVGTSDDRTDDVIVEIASAVAGFSGAVPPVGGIKTRTSQSMAVEPEIADLVDSDCLTEKLSRSYIIDPNDISSAAPTTASSLADFLRSNLVSNGNQYGLRFHPTSINSEAEPGDPGCIDQCEGLYYRRDLPYIVSIEKCRARNIKVSENAARLISLLKSNLSALDTQIDAIRIRDQQYQRDRQTSAALDNRFQIESKTLTQKREAIVSRIKDIEKRVNNYTVAQGHLLYASKSDQNFVGCGDEPNLEEVVATGIVNMPNGSPIAHVTVPGGALVKTDYDIQFENGMLISQKLNRPSEALSLVSLPLKIVRAMLTSVTDVIKLRVDVDSSKTSAAEQQAALIGALRAVSEAKQNTAGSTNLDESDFSE